MRRRKKVTRQRAHTTHGYGSMKKNRGAGNRGGRGRAGSGKRGDANKPHFRVKEKFELGKLGFGVRKKVLRTINISALQEKAEKLIKSGLMTKKNDVYTIDLAKIRIDKLLGSGHPKHKFDIKVRTASEGAIEKIQKAGGKVHILDKKLENIKPSEDN